MSAATGILEILLLCVEHLIYRLHLKLSGWPQAVLEKDRRGVLVSQVLFPAYVDVCLEI